MLGQRFLAFDEIKDDRVLHCLTATLTAGDHQDVELRAGCERGVRQYAHPVVSADRVCGFSHE